METSVTPVNQPGKSQKCCSGMIYIYKKPQKLKGYEKKDTDC